VPLSNTSARDYGLIRIILGDAWVVSSLYYPLSAAGSPLSYPVYFYSGVKGRLHVFLTSPGI
jgi:hypothetical protein